MENLRVEHWHQWETLCCYFMQKIASQTFKQNVRYVSYGSRGQSQFGVDLVPHASTLSVVGQCKLLEHKFHWSDALAEVEKTDKYPNPISFYVIFTTAPKHTTVQDVRNRGVYLHTRPDGTQFRVEVIYWGEIPDLNFIPRQVLEEIFPGAFRLSAPVAPAPVVAAPVASAPAALVKNDYLTSLRALKKNVPAWIGPANLEWLETWDFGQGYVRQQDFKPFADLHMNYVRVEAAFTGIPQWLHEQQRVLIAECLPAGDNFFGALGGFTDVVRGQSIAEGDAGQEVLTLNDMPQDFIRSTVAQWTSAARELATAYRRDVLGQSMGG